MAQDEDLLNDNQDETMEEQNRDTGGSNLSDDEMMDPDRDNAQ